MFLLLDLAAQAERLVRCWSQSVQIEAMRVNAPVFDSGTANLIVSVSDSPGGIVSGISLVVTHEQSLVPPMSRTGFAVQFLIVIVCSTRSPGLALPKFT